MEEETKVYSATITMKDGTEQVITATRNDMVDWMTENNKAKHICQDTDALFARYSHYVELEYNKNHKKPKGERGGARPGAGRKPKGETEKLQYGWRVSRDVWNILQQQDNKTDFIEKAIRAYYRAYGTRKRDDD
jgi:hypothetical protein